MARRNTPQPDLPVSELQSELAEFFMSGAWDHAVSYAAKHIRIQRYGILNGSTTDTEAFRGKKILFERLYEAAGLELPPRIAALFE